MYLVMSKKGRWTEYIGYMISLFHCYKLLVDLC